MTAYYNEHDQYAAAWLETLIAEGLIPWGDVDTRDIQDVSADDLKGYTQVHLFAGIGGWPLALRIAGISDDTAVWTGSCPCQPFSQAGKQKGHEDERHLWPYMFKLIAECDPAVVFGEQVASALGREWLAGVRVSLEMLGREVGAADLCAAGAGAPNIRQRLWWVADAGRTGVQPWCGPREWQRSGLDVGRGGTVGGLADVESVRWPRRGGGSSLDAPAQPERRSALGGLVIADSEGREPRQFAGETLGHWSAVIAASAARRMGDANNKRPQGRFGDRDGAYECAAWPAGVVDFWSRYDVVHCTDGKTRRFEPGSFPLAHGVPNRVGRLRAYGNAINPWIAAEFIRSYYDVVS